MSLNIGKVYQYDAYRPGLYRDYDDMYRDLKTRYADFIKAGKVGFDDRTKLFHIAIAENWHEWMLLSYNQNRINLGRGYGSASGDAQSTGGPHQGNLSEQLCSIQTSLSQLTDKLCALEERIRCLES